MIGVAVLEILLIAVVGIEPCLVGTPAGGASKLRWFFYTPLDELVYQKAHLELFIVSFPARHTIYYVGRDFPLQLYHNTTTKSGSTNVSISLTH